MRGPTSRRAQGCLAGSPVAAAAALAPHWLPLQPCTQMTARPGTPASASQARPGRRKACPPESRLWPHRPRSRFPRSLFRGTPRTALRQFERRPACLPRAQSPTARSTAAEATERLIGSRPCGRRAHPGLATFPAGLRPAPAQLSRPATERAGLPPQACASSPRPPRSPPLDPPCRQRPDPTPRCSRTPAPRCLHRFPRNRRRHRHRRRPRQRNFHRHCHLRRRGRGCPSGGRVCPTPSRTTGARPRLRRVAPPPPGCAARRSGDRTLPSRRLPPAALLVRRVAASGESTARTCASHA
mmetsp:Transcript_4125/g.17337  ORF Transcript_4125/g.17337 Transcript_4125/m.17337 type:complete len:298 (+) Transcript_4125:1717-2610(+)